MMNLRDMSDGKHLRRYIKHRGRCMGIKIQVLVIIDHPRKITFKTLGEGNEAYPSTTEAQTRCKMTHWNEMMKTTI